MLQLTYPCQRFGCRWEKLCEHYHETWASWYHLAIQIWWWTRHSTQFGAHPNWELGSTWFNRRSEWGWWKMSDNDKQLLTFFVQHTQSYRALSYSGVHPTRLWHSWSATWKLDLMHRWITTLCNFTAYTVFSRWDAGLSQPLAIGKIKIKATPEHPDCSKNLKKALALLCFSKPAQSYQYYSNFWNLPQSPDALCIFISEI